MRNARRLGANFGLLAHRLAVGMVIAGMVAASGCTGADPACPFEPEGTCGPGYFRYSDRSCSISAGGGPSACQEEGDGKCYLECETDDDCGGCAPHCASLGLFNEGDFQCNRSVRVCRESEYGDCD